MTVLITSPGRVTPYHLDGEANLLMQIRGSKSVHIFDGNDRDVVPGDELERFWSGDIKAPFYKKHLQDRASTFGIWFRGAGLPILLLFHIRLRTARKCRSL